MPGMSSGGSFALISSPSLVDFGHVGLHARAWVEPNDAWPSVLELTTEALLVGLFVRLVHGHDVDRRILVIEHGLRPVGLHQQRHLGTDANVDRLDLLLDLA